MSVQRLASIDLNLLVALDALLAERSVTAAARKLELTQPALSRTLGRLRELLGDPILVKATRGMQLTARAEQMIEPVRAALDAIDLALGPSAPFDAASSKRTFTIATSDYIEAVLLPRVLGRLTRDAPDIDIDVRPVSGDLAHRLESGEVDLVLGVILDETEGFYRQALFRERFVCIVREDHPRVKSGLDLETYLELGHILIAPRGKQGGIVDDALEQRGRARRVALRLSHYLAAPYVVAETDLCLTVAERVARIACASVPVRQFDVPLELADMQISQFWHARDHKDPAHIWLRTTLANVVSIWASPVAK